VPKIISPGNPQKTSPSANLPPVLEKPPGSVSAADVAVATVTLTGAGAEPLSVTEPGTVQMEPGGAPLQVSLTV